MGMVAAVAGVLWALTPSFTLMFGLVILRAIATPNTDRGKVVSWQNLASFPFGHLLQSKDDPLEWARKELEDPSSRASIFWAILRPVVRVHDPELAKLVLSPKVTIQQTYRNLGNTIPIWGKLFGEGLFMVSGDVWKRQHRIAIRSFGSASTVGFLPSVVTVCERFVSQFVPDAAKAPGELAVFKPSDAFTPLALEVICSIAFGLDDEPEVLKRIADLSVLIFDAIRQRGPLMMIPGYLRLPTPTNVAALAAIDELHNICRTLVKRYRDSERDNEDGQGNLLAVLCDAADGEEKLSDIEVVHNVFAFMVAGMDTTSTTLAHAVCCMASHPSVQNKLFDELGSFSTHEEMLAGATFLPAVLKEVLRLFPPVVGTAGRVAHQDMEVDGLVIHKDQMVTVSSLTMHRSPKVWGADAQVFRPERHLNRSAANNKTGLNFVGGDYDFTSFGGGVRPCIGRHLSLMELKVATSLLIRKYEFVHLPTTTLGPYREHACIAPLPQLKVHGSFEIGVKLRVAS